MKLIKSSFEILPQEEELYGIYKQIELAGRTCYKSEDKITEDSAKGFVDRMIKSGHGAMLEHGTVYLQLTNTSPITGYKYRDNKYSKYVEIRNREKDFPIVNKYITTNYRVIMQGNYSTYSEALENNFDKNWLSDLEYLCEPTEYHEKRVTVKFICDRITGESFLRHRSFLDITKELENIVDLNDFDFSYARESTRFCNFSKDKFSNQLTYIIPTNITIPEGIYKWEDSNPLLTAGGDIETYGYDDSSNLWILDEDGIYNDYKRHYDNYEATELYMKSLQISEDNYLGLINLGWKPEQARYVLNFSLFSPLVMTGFISDWKEFFKLRCDKTAHPDARALAIPLEQEFIKLGYIKQ